MKKIDTHSLLTGILATALVFLLTGQTSKSESYEVMTYWSSHSSYSWGDNVSLWEASWKWSSDKEPDTNLKALYSEGWRLVAYQKTNASAENHQYSWVFERKK